MAPSTAASLFDTSLIAEAAEAAESGHQSGRRGATASPVSSSARVTTAPLAAE